MSKNYLRKILIIVISLSLVLVLIIGLGAVDNQIKLAENNLFLNTFLIDMTDDFVYLRYFGFDLKIPFGLNGIVENLTSFLKTISAYIIILFSKIFIY